jgi:hypothetical protein
LDYRKGYLPCPTEALLLKNTITRNSIMAEPVTHPSEKHELEHLEETRADVDHQLGYGPVKSRWDELSIHRTLWVFKRIVLVSIAVYTGYICEGFEVSERHHLPCIAGSVVALTDAGLCGIAQLFRLRQIKNIVILKNTRLKKEERE